MRENFQELKDYVHLKYSIPYEQLKPDSEIERDLQITGDDAVEFIDDIFIKFNIKCDRFDYGRYFDPEGFGLINFSKVIGMITRKSKQPAIKQRLTLGDIEKAIDAGICHEI